MKNQQSSRNKTF